MDTMERIESLSKGLGHAEKEPDGDFQMDTITQIENSKAGAHSRSEERKEQTGL